MMIGGDGNIAAQGTRAESGSLARLYPVAYAVLWLVETWYSSMKATLWLGGGDMRDS